jgi:hypothetical protein
MVDNAPRRFSYLAAPAKNGQTDLKRAERARLPASALGRTTSACTADVRIGTQ